jgi:hypothetical protein
MYIMEIVYYIKVNISRLEHNSGMIIIHGKDQIFNLSFVELIFLNKV